MSGVLARERNLEFAKIKAAPNWGGNLVIVTAYWFIAKKEERVILLYGFHSSAGIGGS